MTSVMIKNNVRLTGLVFFVLVFSFFSNAWSFELKYLHGTGQDIDYILEIVKKNQKTVIDINRHVDSVVGTDITITTSFTDAKTLSGGIERTYGELIDSVSRTIMDDHGVVSSVAPLSSFKNTMDSLSLNLERDLMNKLGVSSFPQGDLSVGSSWTKNASKGSTSSTFVYTVDQENISMYGYTSVVKIRIESDIALDEVNEIADVKKTSYNKGDIIIRGALYFDINTGRIIQIEQNMTYHILNIMIDFNGTPLITCDDDVVTAKLVIQ